MATQAIFESLAAVFNSDPGEKVRGVYQSRVDIINSMEDQMKVLDDQQLRGKTDLLRGRLENGESLEDVLPEAFAVRSPTCLKKPRRITV